MKRYESMASGHQAGSRPEDLIIVGDSSGSMGWDDYLPTRLDGAKQAAGSLLRIKRDLYPEDRVGIVSFSLASCQVHRLAKARGSHESLVDSLASIYAHGGTNISAGLARAGAMLSRKVPFSTLSIGGWASSLLSAPRREALGRIVLLSDGQDTERGEATSLATTLKDQGVAIDVIGIGGSPQDVDEELLRAISSKDSGGSPRYVFIDDTEGLIRKFEELAHHIKVCQP